jgi:hypothetical protein
VRYGHALRASVAIAALAACREGDNSFRGHGLKPAALTAESQARVYEAAARGAFEVDDPALSLLLDPRVLPRAAGYGPGPALPDAVRGELRSRGVIKGACPAPDEGTKKTLLCRAPRPGYVVRFSDVLQLGAGSDSVQVYMYVQKYDTPESGATEAMRFERAYQVVKRSDEWTAVREGRVPRPSGR